LDGPERDGRYQKFGHLDTWVNGPLQPRTPASADVKYADAGRFYKTYLDDADEARADVRRLLKMGVDVIKVHHMLEPEVLKAITDEAHRANVSVVGHRVDARELAELGMDFVEHTAPVAVATVTDQEILKKLREGTLIDPTPFMDPAAFKPLFKTLASKNIFWNPTLAETWFGASPKRDQFKAEMVAFYSNPNLKYIPRAELDPSGMYDILDQVKPADADLLQKGFRNIQLALKAFADAGGKILVSPDSGTIRLGIGMHQEMELLVDSGIDPGEVLRGATLYPAQLLRQEKELGTIAVGKLADLVVLGADPLANITNTRKIEKVFMDGREVDRSFHPDYSVPIPRPVEIERAGAGSISNVVPNIATEGDGDLTIELTGRFRPSVKVMFNKVPLQSKFDHAGRMTAVIPSRLLTVGTYPIQLEDSFEGETRRSNRIFFVVKYKSPGATQSRAQEQ
jgi:imidazolonepropionase-like amidohydrolase